MNVATVVVLILYVYLTVTSILVKEERSMTPTPSLHAWYSSFTQSKNIGLWNDPSGICDGGSLPGGENKNYLLQTVC